jgi:hypothetical protein
MDKIINNQGVQQIIEASQSAIPVLTSALKSVGNIMVLVLEFIVNILRKVIGQI